MKHPLITLTTDFGLADHFVAAMKGVILGIAPQARIVDISHQIEPFAIAQAAFTLDQAARCFPRGTVHVAVVDPGVGSARRPLLVEAGGHYFVAPDNGLLTMIYARSQPRVRVITAGRYFRHPLSRTFHGRDIFAPVAAHLALGAAPASFGKPISDYVRGEFERPVQTAAGRWRASILAVDRFGNLITNLPAADFAFLGQVPFRLKAGRRVVKRWAENYSEAAVGELLLLAGSSDYLEVAAREASAARLCGCAAGDVVELRCARTGGATPPEALTRTTAGRG